MKQKIFIFIMLAAFCTLIGLGTWQVKRMEWKAGVLKNVDQAQTADAVTFPTDEVNDEWDYRRVKLTGEFLPDHKFKLLSRIYQGAVGYHVIEPFKLIDGRYVLVNRGFIPNAYNGEYAPPEGEITLTGTLHKPDDKNMFTPENHESSKDLYWLDAQHIADITGIEFTTNMVVFQDKTADGKVYPIGGQLRIDIPNNHKKYAFFWYTMALILVIMVFIMWLKNHQPRKGD